MRQWWCLRFLSIYNIKWLLILILLFLSSASPWSSESLHRTIVGKRTKREKNWFSSEGQNIILDQYWHETMRLVATETSCFIAAIVVLENMEYSHTHTHEIPKNSPKNRDVIWSPEWTRITDQINCNFPIALDSIARKGRNGQLFWINIFLHQNKY